MTGRIQKIAAIYELSLEIMDAHKNVVVAAGHEEVADQKLLLAGA